VDAIFSLYLVLRKYYQAYNTVNNVEKGGVSTASANHTDHLQAMPAPAGSELQEQVNRILQSPGFSGAEILRKLLSHFARATVEQPGRSIKEHEIAVHVLGRGDNFDPRIESSVRVHTGRLRAKLAEFYQGPGASDPIEISIPKGAYHLTCRYRHGFAPLTASPQPLQNAKRDWKSWLPWSMAVVASAAVLLLWSTRQPGAPASIRRFWTAFDSRPDETLIVFSNPRFTGNALSDGLRYAPAGASVSPQDLHDRYTGTGEAIGLQEITRLFDHLGLPVRAKRSQLLAWDEARNRNLVFIGGPDVNDPQMELPRLQQFSFKAGDQEPRLGIGAVVNVRPAGAEEPYYFNSGPPYSVDYAVIGLVPGLDKRRRALILAGTTTYGTQGAVEQVLDEHSVAELMKKLGADRGPLPFFEALIRVKVSGGVPVQRELVIVRRRQ
jgi:hypothetical protein